MKFCWHNWTKVEFYYRKRYFYKGLNTETKERELVQWTRRKCLKCGKVSDKKFRLIGCY